MKKKVLKMLSLILIMVGVTACGAEVSETVENVSDLGAVSDEQGTAKEVLTTDEQPKEKLIWYMDKEGIKSEELGMMIKKDNGELDNLEINMRVFERKASGQNVWCVTYRDESLDEFMTNYMECFVTYENNRNMGHCIINGKSMNFRI